MRNKWLKTTKKVLSFALALSMMLTQTPMLFGGSAAQTNFDIKEEDSPTHHKTIVDNGDGTFDINLDVHGYEAKKVNVAMVIDVSNSMTKSISGQEAISREELLFDSVNAFVDQLYGGHATDEVEVNVSVVAFAGTAKILQTWTDTKEGVVAAVNEAQSIAVNSYFPSGTNPQSGLELANVLYSQDELTAQIIGTTETATVSTNRPANMDTAENYVLLFSDGGPNRCYVNRDQIAVTYESGQAPADDKLYYLDGGTVATLTEITYVDGVKHALYNGATYRIVRNEANTEDGFTDSDDNWHKLLTVEGEYNNKNHSLGIDYPGTDGYTSFEEFYNDYGEVGEENLTAAVLSSAPVMLNREANGDLKIATPDWTYDDDAVYDVVNIVSPYNTDYRKIAAQAALVEVEDIYEYAESRHIEIDVMTFGVGGWFTDNERDSKFPTAQRFLDLVAAVGNGTLSAYEAEEAYLLDEVRANSMPTSNGDIDIADYTKVYTSSNTADAYKITDRNYNGEASPWLAEPSAAAEVADWSYLDLGGLYAINAVEINWARIPGDFEVKIALMNPADTSTWAEGGDASTSSNWTSVYTGSKGDTNSASKVTFDVRAVRYVMVYSPSRTETDADGNYVFGIDQIHVKQETADNNNVNEYFDAENNFALNKTVMVPWNATTSYEASDETTTLLTDGSTETIYSMTETDAAAVRDGVAIDLENARNVNKVVIHWQYAPVSFVIETSYGDYSTESGYKERANVITSEVIEYDSVEGAENTLTGTTTIEFDTVKARYIGIKSENRNLIDGVANWAIKEIEVYATEKETDAFALPPAYNIYGIGIAPLDSVTTNASGAMTSAPYYYINDAYDADRVHTLSAKALNADVSFDVAQVIETVQANSFGGDSQESYIEDFKKLIGTVLEGFARVHIYDTFSKYITLAHEITGMEQKAGITSIDSNTTTWTNPSWLTVKSYTSSNNEDGKNTSDSSVDYVLDEVQIDKANYTTYYHQIADPNGGEMPTEVVELRFAEEYILDNQSKVILTVTVKPSQYAIDALYNNLTAEDYVAYRASYDANTGYSSANPNGTVNDNGVDPLATVYDRRTTGGYPDQAFNVVFGADETTGQSLYNTANPYYADDSAIISAQIAERQWVKGEYGFHTNVLAASNVEYYITAINAINAEYADNIMTASYDMPVFRPKLINLPVRKVWNDGGLDHAGEPVLITVSWEQTVWQTAYDESGIASVLNAGTETKSITIELNENNAWQGIIENLPQGYTYTVTETYKDGTPVDSYSVSMDETYNVSTDDISVDGHTFTIGDTDITDAQLGDGLVIYNTVTVDKTVTKLWQGDDEATRPMNVTVRLMADGVAYGEDVVLSAENNWSYTWTGLDEYSKDGVKIDYHIVEVDMSEYIQYVNNDYELLTRYGSWDYYMSDTDDVDENWYAEDYSATNTVWTNDGTNIFSGWYGTTPNWTTSKIWLRQNFEIADISALADYEDLYLDVWYDQPFEVYINGTKALDFQEDVAMFNGRLKLPTEAKSLLKTGTNLIAIHADFELNTDGSGSMIHAGLVANTTAQVPADTDYQIKTVTSREIFPAGSDWLYYNSAIDDAVPNWAHAEFDSIGWPSASAPFGNTEGYVTEAGEDYLWLRKNFTIATNEELEALKASNLYLRANINENVDVFINGRHVHSHLEATTGTTLIPLGADASEILELGTANVIAIKLVNAEGTTDGVYFDASLVAVSNTASTTNSILTNVHQSTTKEFSVVSVWDDQDNVDGIRPEYVTVQLYKDGVAEGDIVVLCPDDAWSYTWGDLEVGAEYTVVQSTADGYTTTYDYSTANLAVITNVHTPETLDKVVTKIWNDENNQDALRPEEIKVQLYANGKEYGDAVRVTGSGNVWNYTWTGLPKYERGREILWSAQEVDVPYGYAATYSDDRWTITNSHTSGITSRTVTKLWEDNNSADRPTEVAVQLYANAAPMPEYQSALVSTSSKWYAYFSSTETTHDGWNEAGFGNVGYGEYQAPFGNIGSYNTAWEFVDVDLDAVDDGYYIYIRQEFNIRSQALLDEIKASDLILRTRYDQDPVYYINGQQVYSASGFTTDYTDITLDDTAKNALQVGVNCIAVRVDNAGADLPDGRFIDAGLYFNRSFTATLNAENNWTHTWDNLPLKNNGLAIKYAVYETNVPEGYSASYTTDKYDSTKLNVINTLTRDITVTKAWIDDNNALGIRPSSIDVQLFANGELYGEAVTITDDGNGNWTHTWTDVPYYVDGAEVAFSVSEVVPNGYVPYYVGTDGNLTIQNYASDDLESYSVKKTWDDMDDINKLRPEYITVQLYQGYGESFAAYGRPIKLSASNNWTYTWEDLLNQIVVDGNTQDVTYYAEELEVPYSYTVSYSHSIASAFTEIVNTMHVQSIVLQKQDGFDPEIFLPGAEFKMELLASDGITVDTNFAARKGVTDNEGLLVFENITVGHYLITETKAPEGYNPVEPFGIEVSLAAQNVAAGADAYVADESASATASNEAITDNDPTTEWTSASMTDSFYIDFGVDRAVNKIDIYFENAPINMTVEYLAAGADPEDENAQWRTLGTYAVYNANGHTGALIPDTDQEIWGTGHMIVEFDTVVARYIRVSGDEAPINPLENTTTKYNVYQVRDVEVFLDKTYEYAQDGFAYASSVFTEADREGDIFQYTYMDMASNVGDSLTHRDDNNNDDGMYYGLKEEDYTTIDLDPDTEGLQKPEEWLAVDLLENVTIDKLRIEWENASNNFSIIYLEDGCAEGDWLDFSKYKVYTGSSRTTQIDDNGNEVDMVTHTSDNYYFTEADVKVTDTWWYIGESIIYLDTPINARYIGLVSTERLCTVIGGYRDTYYAIREIDMYNTASANPEFDHALSKSAYSYNVRQREEYLPSSAIDKSASNYLETMWVSDNDVEEQMSDVGNEGVEGDDTQYKKSYRTSDYKEWINVKLDGTVGINHIVLEWADSNTELDWGNGKPLPWDTNKTTVTLTYPEEYYILYSLDGSYWTEFYHVTNANGGRDEYTFHEIEAKYVRVYIPDGVRNAGAGTSYALYSLELYSTADQYVVIPNTPRTKNSEVVIDYGLPVDVDVMADQLASIQQVAALEGVGVYDRELEYNAVGYDSGINSTEAVGKYGTLTVVNGKLRYTPTTMCFEDEDVFTYCLRIANKDGSYEYKYSTLTVMPATSVQYEEDFGTITYADGNAVENGRYLNPTNIAQGKTVYSDSNVPETDLLTDGIGFVDGSSPSRISWGTDDGEEFFAVDLGENKDIRELFIDWENCSNSFKVIYLADGGDATDITSYTVLERTYTAEDIDVTSTGGRGSATIKLDTTINARYVGIVSYERYSSYFYSVYEIEAYSELRADTAVTNLASGKLGYSLGEQGTANMTDGNLSTTHASGVTYVEGTPEFFAVDLGENTVVNKMTVAFENAAEEFYIAYLSGNGDPTDITAYSRLTTKYTSADVTMEDAGWGRGTITINFEKAINARYVGIYVTDRYVGTSNNKNFLKVREMELYNTTVGTQGLWTEVNDGTTGHKDIQDTDRPGKGNVDDADNAYGFDSAYDASAMFGLGNARKVTVSAANNPYTNEGAAWPTATFTFTGTGFDIIALTSNTTGTIWVHVYEGTSTSGSIYKSWLVDTYYGYNYDSETGEWGINPDALNSLYQIPVINGKDFAYGTYTVQITASYARGFDHTKLSQYDFYFDGVRVYNSAGSSDIELGATITGAYIADNEYNPNVTEIKTNLVNVGDLTANGQATGATFVDGRNALDTANAAKLASAMDEFKNCGPNNEIYLAYGQGIAFDIYSEHVPTGIKIGFKSITGDEVTATVKFGLFGIGDYTMYTSTTRYYDTTNFIGWGGIAPVDYTYNEATGMYKSNSAIVISNTMEGSGILSVTNIKLTYAENAGVEDYDLISENATALSGHVVSNARVNAYLVSSLQTVEDGYATVREQYLADKYDFVPEGFKTEWNVNSTAQDEKVILTVTTSADVKALTANGIEATAKYYSADGSIKASDIGAKKAVWTVELQVDCVGEYLAEIEAIAENGDIFAATASIYSVA